MSHTPGPWKWGGDPFYDLVGGDGESILYYTNNDDGIRAHNAADARLIATAPDLLASLIALLDNKYDPTLDVWMAAHAAIERATGKSIL